MEIKFTRSFEDDYRTLPPKLQRITDEKLFFLLKNSRHPSLRIKKMEGYSGVWEARISQGYRCTFSIVGKTYLIRRIGPHDILRKP